MVMNAIVNTLCTVTWKVNPVAFHLGSVEVRWYGILLATGFLLAYYTLQQIFKTEKLSQKLLDKISIWTIVWTIVGLRLGHFLFTSRRCLSRIHYRFFYPLMKTGILLVIKDLPVMAG